MINTTIADELYQPIINEMKDVIQQLERENALLKAKIEGFESARQLFSEGYKAGKEK